MNPNMCQSMKTCHTCPTPTKRGFPTEGLARVRLIEIIAHPQPGTLDVPCRAYLCTCGSWHLTHNPAREVTRPTPFVMAHEMACAAQHALAEAHAYGRTSR